MRTNNLKKVALASGFMPIEHKTFTIFASSALPMSIDKGGKMDTNTMAMIRGTVTVSETERGRPFAIMTIVDVTHPISRKIEIEIITTIAAPRADEGVESLHDQQYTMTRVAAPETSMMIHSANAVGPVKGDTWKI